MENQEGSIKWRKVRGGGGRESKEEMSSILITIIKELSWKRRARGQDF
jgi:hypothetical protein